MLKSVRVIFDILFSKKERRQIVWLLLGILTMGFMEMVGIASLMPFLAVVINSEVIQENRYLSLLYSTFEFQRTQDFLFWLGLGLLALLILNSAVSAVIMWRLLRFTNMRGHILSQWLLTNYLSQPYSYFLDRNGSELVKSTIEDVNRFVGCVANPLMGTLVKGVAILFKIASEGIGGIKDLKILGREADYVRRFSEPSRTFARHERQRTRSSACTWQMV